MKPQMIVLVFLFLRKERKKERRKLFSRLHFHNNSQATLQRHSFTLLFHHFMTRSPPLPPSSAFILRKLFSPVPLSYQNKNDPRWSRSLCSLNYFSLCLKNKDGFVTTIITRRVVVDKNGYGIVYEQNTNERGVNSFYKNGSPITEFVWMNESTGINLTNK